MSNYKGLHIQKDKIDEVVQAFTKRCSERCDINKSLLNEPNHHYRYTIEMDELKFEVDFFFKKDGKTTMKPQGTEEKLKMSTELCEYICEVIAYRDVTSGKFNIHIDEARFRLLKEYLYTIEGVTVCRDEKVNCGRGEILQLISDIGDKITLTYYTSTSNLYFDGLLMKLHAEVKCFLAAYEHVETIQNIIVEANKDEIEEKIAKLLEKSYNSLDILLQNLLYDSLAQITYRVPSKDYSVWVFPALKALEGRIKQILDRNSIRINDKKGFTKRVTENGLERDKPIFIKDTINHDKFIVDTSIVNISDGNTLEELNNCYTYFNKNRHMLFHTKQQLQLTRVLTKPEDAEIIVFDVCNMFENSFKKLGY